MFLVQLSTDSVIRSADINCHLRSQDYVSQFPEKQFLFLNFYKNRQYSRSMKYPIQRMQLVLGLFNNVTQKHISDVFPPAPRISKCGTNGRMAAFSEEPLSTLNCWINLVWHNVFRTSKYIHTIYAKTILSEQLQKLSAVTSLSFYIVRQKANTFMVRNYY